MILIGDLHIHSALSSCAENDMTPGNIVSMSLLNELQMISITDHSSCKNIPAAIRISEKMRDAGQQAPVVIPGMEMECAEGFHLLAYFPSEDIAMAFDDFYSQHMIALPNKKEIFGDQLIFDDQDQVEGQEDYLLSVSSTLTSDQLTKDVMERGGVVIPAHIDRDSYSMLSSLGVIPPEFPGKYLEISSQTTVPKMLGKRPDLAEFHFVSNSDAHMLTQISDPGFGYQIDRRLPNNFSCEDFVSALREQMIR